MTSLLPLPKVSRVDAAAELLRRRNARRSLLDFTLHTKADYSVSWHHRALCTCLDRFAAGEIKRLMVFMPPRHGKSELTSRRLPAYIFGQNPDAKIIACSYSADLSSRMNRDVQRIMDDPKYRRLFPQTSLWGSNVRTMASGSWLRNSDIFEIVGRDGCYRSAGVMGGITGMGFDFGIIDDPVKDAREAASAVTRDAVWEWYTSTFSSRQAKGAGILVTMTRWHADDLAGRLLDQAQHNPSADQWTVIRLPAIAEDDPGPDDPRRPGDALWPERFDEAFLSKVRANGEYQWASLYQQRPQLREGGLFKREWFGQFVEASPLNARRVRYWDKAATHGGGCYTCGVLMARADDGRYYIEHVVRGQWSPQKRDQVILQTAQADRDRYGEYQPGICVEKEGGSSGVDAAVATAQLLDGFPFHADRPSGDKTVRAEPFASQCEAGNVLIVRPRSGSWDAQSYIEELCLFPQGAYADQVDASSGAFNRLATRGSARAVGELLCWPPVPGKAENSDQRPRIMPDVRHATAPETNGLNLSEYFRDDDD